MAIATLGTGKSGDNARALVMPDGAGKIQVQSIAYPRGQYPTIATISGIAAANVSGSSPWDLASVTVPSAYVIDTLDAAYLWLGGACSISGGTIPIVLAYVDAAGRIVQTSAPQSLTPQAAWQSGGKYLAFGDPLRFDLVGAAQVKILVPTAPTGTWDLYPVLYV